MSRTLSAPAPSAGGAPAARRATATNRFVLLSTQRSGTSWLMERLAAHPEIGAYSEMLLRNRDGWPDWPPGAGDRPYFETYLKDRVGGYTRRQAHLHLFRYLDYLYEPRRELRAIGFKLMYYESRPFPELLAYLRTRRVRVLHLFRENLLDIAISQIAMDSRRFPHAWSPEQRESVRVDIDTRYLLKLLRRHERERRIARALVRAARLDVHELTYEDLVADDRHLDGVLRFLDVEPLPGAELQAALLKLAPLSQRAGISNFEDVEAALRGTGFERFLRRY